MPDSNFFTFEGPLSIGDAAALASATLVSGSEKHVINRVAESDDQNLIDAVIYCAEKSHIEKLAGKKIGLCLTTEKLKPAVADVLEEGPIATLASPRLGFALIATRLHQAHEHTETAVHTSFGDGVSIDPSAVISAGASLGAGARIGAHVFIGPGVKIGEKTIIEPGSTISHAIIGKGCRILSGARIGQAGFGFVESPAGLYRVPQLGRVMIHDDVEIGANSCIDRGALGDTVIGEGTKIDNLVQIAHNVRVGRHCVLAAQTGISGSCVIGDGVFMGGQVGLSDHLTIGDGAQIAAGSGLMRDVPPGERWGGAPARTVREWLRETAALSKLAKNKNG